MDGTPVEYKGWGLTPIVSRTPDAFLVVLLVEKPNGIRRAMGPLGQVRIGRGRVFFRDRIRQGNRRRVAASGSESGSSGKIATRDARLQ